MSDISEKPLYQYRKPEGEAGRQVVETMNENHYELTSWGLEQVKIDPAFTVADIGCGGGRTVERLSKIVSGGKVYGVDYSEDCVRWASERNKDEIESGRVLILQASVEKLPFGDNSLDMAFAVETVYFWPDLEKNFAEVQRVIKNGGQFVIINEAYENEAFRERNDELRKYGSMKILSPEKTTELLKNAGFSAVEYKTREDKNWICFIATK